MTGSPYGFSGPSIFPGQQWPGVLSPLSAQGIGSFSSSAWPQQQILQLLQSVPQQLHQLQQLTSLQHQQLQQIQQLLLLVPQQFQHAIQQIAYVVSHHLHQIQPSSSALQPPGVGTPFQTLPFGQQIFPGQSGHVM